jgi:two-component system chemotaxis response regulator CheY
MKHCLVVDHSPALRTIARRILESLQYTVTEAADGITALAACRKAMPDLIFLDWNLPHMTGIEFIKTLRSQPNSEQARILFCNSELNKGQIALALAAGADEFILKPFDSAQIRTKLTAIGLAA